MTAKGTGGVSWGCRSLHFSTEGAALIPILHLKGNSTGDFDEALAALVGRDAGGLSASTIARLKQVWTDEPARWPKRDLSVKQYVSCVRQVQQNPWREVMRARPPRSPR